VLTLLADPHLPWLEHILPDSVSISRIENGDHLQSELRGKDALLIRTVNKINRSTFPVFPKKLSFIGAATAGTDHVDIEWVRENNITFAHSPGCNARSVAEYVITAIFAAFNGDLNEIRKMTVGIVGFGHTGGNVSKLLNQLGIRWIACDPPLEIRNPEFKSAALDDVLNCDIVSLHVPLTNSGLHPTKYLINKKSILNRRIRLFIHASRGGVADETALLEALDSGSIERCVIDVWEGEPETNPDLLEKAFIVTPHIAGYSQQAKYNASYMVCRQLAHHFSLPFNKETPDELKTINVHSIEELNQVMKTHPMFELGKKLRENPTSFAHLRNTHPLRSEFRFGKIQL